MLGSVVTNLCQSSWNPWLFWNLWGFHPGQDPTQHAVSLWPLRKRHLHPIGTDLHDPDLPDPVHTENKGGGPPASAGRLLPRQGGVAGMSLSQDDFKADQVLLKMVVSNLSLQGEVVKESSHSLVNILAIAGPSKVALPLNEAIMDPVKVLWQTPFSTTSKRAQR